MAPFLFGGIIALIVAGLVGSFFPFSKTMDLVYGIGGSLLFSAYIVFDVSMPLPCALDISYPLYRLSTSTSDSLQMSTSWALSAYIWSKCLARVILVIVVLNRRQRYSASSISVCLIYAVQTFRR